MKSFAFDPASASVNAGQKVVFTNDDDATHNVVASDDNINSGDIAAGKSWSYTFTKAGTYKYVCTYHPWMKGEITVTNSK